MVSELDFEILLEEVCFTEEVETGEIVELASLLDILVASVGEPNVVAGLLKFVTSEVTSVTRTGLEKGVSKMKKDTHSDK